MNSWKLSAPQRLKKERDSEESHTKLTNLYSMPKLPVLKHQGALFDELEDLNVY